MTTTSKRDEGYGLVELDEDHAKAHAFNMLFMVWRRRTLAVAYRRGIALVHELATAFPEGVGICQVVEMDAIPPDSEARTAFVEFLKLPAVKHCSVIHDGSGFKAAAIRAVVTSALAIARPTARHAVLSRVADAGRWHAAAQRDLGRSESAELIAAIATRLRALHVERYPSP